MTSDRTLNSLQIAPLLVAASTEMSTVRNLCRMRGRVQRGGGGGRWAESADQQEGESGEADASGSKQSRLHGRVLTHLPGAAGELAEAVLEERRGEEESSRLIHTDYYLWFPADHTHFLSFSFEHSEE